MNSTPKNRSTLFLLFDYHFHQLQLSCHKSAPERRSFVYHYHYVNKNFFLQTYKRHGTNLLVKKSENYKKQSKLRPTVIKKVVCLNAI